MKLFIKNEKAANLLAAAGFEVEPGKKRFLWEPNWDYEWVQLGFQSGFFVHMDGESVNKIKRELHTQYGVLASGAENVRL